jgi:DNA-binding NarL/FixJ family response regulator
MSGRHPTAGKAAFGVEKMCRILVVDDNEPLRRGIQSLLRSRKGWVVCGEAADGLEAVEEAKSLRPDLIIMDVSMPNMNGLEATRVILREVRESRILIISQNDPAIVRRQAVEAHAHGFIEKSNIHRDLIAAVEGILSGDGQSQTEKTS